MSFTKEAKKMVEDRPFLALSIAGTIGYYAYLKQIQMVVESAVEDAIVDTNADVPLIFSQTNGINGMGINSGLGMTTSTSTTTSSSHMPGLRDGDDSAGEPSMEIPADSGLFGVKRNLKKKFSQVGGSARRRLGTVALESSPVYGATIDTQLSMNSADKNAAMTNQHADILGFSGLSAGQSGHWFE